METRYPQGPLSEESPKTEERPSIPAVPASEGQTPLSLNQITGFRDKMTYIFSKDGEVGCIHYDALREEIFFNGHNVRGMNLTPDQWRLLEEFRNKLRHHPGLNANRYAKTLLQIAKEKDYSLAF